MVYIHPNRVLNCKAAHTVSYTTIGHTITITRVTVTIHNKSPFRCLFYSAKTVFVVSWKRSAFLNDLSELVNQQLLIKCVERGAGDVLFVLLQNLIRRVNVC